MVCLKKTKRKKYDVKTLKEALNAIGQGQTIREAAYVWHSKKYTSC